MQGLKQIAVRGIKNTTTGAKKIRLHHPRSCVYDRGDATTIKK